MRNSVIRLVVVLVGFSGLMLPVQSFAQGKSSALLEEVIVTARKREENLQDAPIAVSAFTGAQLDFRGLSDIEKLDQFTPNLVLNKSPTYSNVTNAAVYIRGIGQNDFTPVIDPGVGIYIDGVYLGRSVGAVLDLVDVERIEILRGPQGTLFGRNTIGGAVSLHLKKPTDEFGGKVSAKYGTDNRINVRGTLNVPITDQLFARFNIASFNQDGYVIRVFDGKDLGDDNTIATRAALRWLPTDDLEINLSADYSRDRENGSAYVLTGIQPISVGLVSGGGPSMVTANNTIAAQLQNGGIMPDGVFFNPVNPPTGFPFNFLACEDPANFDNASCFNTRYIDDGSKKLNFGTDPVTADLDVWGVSGELTWDVNEWLSIKSITGYREMEMESSRDGDNTPANIFATRDMYDHEQISQELQFSGQLMDERLQWLVGLYYFQEEGSNINPVILPVGSLQSGGFYDNDSYAAFFQSTYSVNDQLDLTFGIRYTEDTKRYMPDQIALGDASQGPGSIFGPTWTNFTGIYLSSTGPMLPGERILPFQEFKKKFDDVNVLANIAYNWTDELMTYFTYSEGFKTGGFDQRFAAPPIDPVTGALTNAPSTFDPETVKSFEIGVKSQWLDNRVRLNLALFHTDYSDLQLIIRETFNPITFNGGTANINGGEIELTWVPTDRWLITAAVGHIDAEYGTLSDSVLNNATPILPGNKLINTPKWSSAVGAAYTFDVSDWATLTPRLDWSFHGKQFNDGVNTAQLFQDSYHLLNAGIALQTNDGRWEGVLAFRNITDEKYIITGNSAFATAASYVSQVYGRPFAWSISLKYNFF